MRSNLAQHDLTAPADDVEEMLLDVEEDEDDLDDVAALAVHNQQLHRYLREA